MGQNIMENILQNRLFLHWITLSSTLDLFEYTKQAGDKSIENW